MPGANQFAADSLASRIRLWLLDNPPEPGRGHRPRDIAAGLGIPDGVSKSRWTVRVGTECGRMTDRFGILERVPGEVMTRGNVPASTYRLPQT